MVRKSVPIVVIVGRTNVGKSTLFNRLSVNVKSLTYDYSGVTRDLIKDRVNWQGSAFELIDTGGISLRKTQDPIEKETRARAIAILKQADIVLFVCDGKIGVVQEDREISKLLHKTVKNVFLLVNKIDTKIAQEHLHEFERLGHQPIFPISAQHGTAIGDLLEALVERLPVVTHEEDEDKLQPRVVLLGKPNVGKSSLLNLILNEERAIVADMPGTTREAITDYVRFYKEDIKVTDTAGVRRKRSVNEPLEGIMVKSTLHALKEANIVLLLIDSSAGRVSDQELKLAFYAFQDLHKAVVLLFNKQDITDDYTKTTMEYHLEEYEHLTKKVISLDISCKTGKNIGRILPLVEKIWERHTQKFSDDELTMLFKEALNRKPLHHKTQPLHIYDAKQVSVAPITIAMRVNHPHWFGPSQLGFFENILRGHAELQGVPIRFLMRSRR